MALLENIETGEIQVLNTIHIIGRSTKSNLHLKDSDISKIHVTIFWESDDWYIKCFDPYKTRVLF